MSIRQEGKSIKRLRVLPPSFDCEPGCTDCCNVVPFSEWEWSQVPEEKRRSATGLRCPYAMPAGGCAIYEHRPMICRVFGSSEDERIACPRGCRPERPLAQARTDSLMREYMSWFRPEGRVFGPFDRTEVHATGPVWEDAP